MPLLHLSLVASRSSDPAYDQLHADEVEIEVRLQVAGEAPCKLADEGWQPDVDQVAWFGPDVVMSNRSLRYPQGRYRRLDSNPGLSAGIRLTRSVGSLPR